MANVEPHQARIAVHCAAGFALALVLVGCGSGPMTMYLRPNETVHTRHTAAQEIRIGLIPTATETAGVLGSRALKPQGLDTLLVTRLESLSNHQYRVVVLRQDATLPNPQPTALTISLAKAYVQQVHDSKSGVVVLNVEQAGRVSHLRGQSTGLNWWGSSEEMAGALTDALDRALKQLRPLLDAAATAESAQPAQH